MTDLSDSPLISIVTPSYNQGRFIEQTLQSIHSQGYPHVEHIVVDGGSTDETLDILTRYGESCGLQWISEADDGQADALQKGFKLCRGEITSWLNSDDVYLSPNVLERVVSLFRAYPQADIITGGGVELAADGQWMRRIEIMPRHINYQRLRLVDHVLQPATFFRRAALDSVQIDTSLHYAFDWDLFIQMAREHNILAVNEPWAGYRMWGENKTDAGGAARARELLTITARYVGQRSWQYYLVGLFYISLKLTETLPGSARRPLRRGIKSISYWLQVLSNHRVTSV